MWIQYAANADLLPNFCLSEMREISCANVFLDILITIVTHHEREKCVGVVSEPDEYSL